MNNCSNCLFTEYECKIYEKLKTHDNGFFIANKFIETKKFCCNQWEPSKNELIFSVKD